MGLFSKRRNAGFDPELWSDANDRAEGRGNEAWFEDFDGDDPALDDLETNSGASFADSDAEWLTDDPGEAVRGSKS